MMGKITFFYLMDIKIPDSSNYFWKKCKSKLPDDINSCNNHTIINMDCNTVLLVANFQAPLKGKLLFKGILSKDQKDVEWTKLPELGLPWLYYGLNGFVHDNSFYVIGRSIGTRIGTHNKLCFQYDDGDLKWNNGPALPQDFILNPVSILNSSIGMFVLVWGGKSYNRKLMGYSFEKETGFKLIE